MGAAGMSRKMEDWEQEKGCVQDLKENRSRAKNAAVSLEKQEKLQFTKNSRSRHDFASIVGYSNRVAKLHINLPFLPLLLSHTAEDPAFRPGSSAVSAGGGSCGKQTGSLQKVHAKVMVLPQLYFILCLYLRYKYLPFLPLLYNTHRTGP